MLDDNTEEFKTDWRDERVRFRDRVNQFSEWLRANTRRAKDYTALHFSAEKNTAVAWRRVYLTATWLVLALVTAILAIITWGIVCGPEQAALSIIRPLGVMVSLLLLVVHFARPRSYIPQHTSLEVPNKRRPSLRRPPYTYAELNEWQIRRILNGNG